MKKLILFFALTTMIALSGCYDPDYYYTYFNIENATQAEITFEIERIGKIIIPSGETKLIYTDTGRGIPSLPSSVYVILDNPAVTINGRLASDAFWQEEYWTMERGYGNEYCTYTLTLTDQLLETLLLPNN